MRAFEELILDVTYGRGQRTLSATCRTFTLWSTQKAPCQPGREQRCPNCCWDGPIN